MNDRISEGVKTSATVDGTHILIGHELGHVNSTGKNQNSP